MINRFLFLMFFVGILFINACTDDEPKTPVTTTTQPNILLIIADDMGIDATPGYSIGNEKPTMPNLQTLMSEGLTFDNMWANPICSPTRSAILTGKYGYRTGVLNATSLSNIPITEKTLHAYLTDNNLGYSHSIIGKWHLSNDGNTANQMGIDYYTGLVTGALQDYYQWNIFENGTTNQTSEYATTKFTDLAIDWIGQQDKPWFCWLAYTTPHTPFHLPPAGTHSQGNLPTDQASIDADPMLYFLAMIENMDYEIGRLLNSMTTAERENTIIIFIGDNGTMRTVNQLPYRPKSSKGSLYQGGVHVPMVIAGKGVSRVGEREAALVNVTDLFTTIANLAGANMETYQDSYAFNNLLTTTGSAKRNYNYAEISDVTSGYTIRNMEYKLIVNDDGTEEFYDLVTDAYETSDLLQNTLTLVQQTAKTELETEAASIRQ
jgi:arylsulfatase A-like enzyme